MKSNNSKFNNARSQKFSKDERNKFEKSITNHKVPGPGDCKIMITQTSVIRRVMMRLIDLCKIREFISAKVFVLILLIVRVIQDQGPIDMFQNFIIDALIIYIKCNIASQDRANYFQSYFRTTKILKVTKNLLKTSLQELKIELFGILPLMNPSF